jgi:hypothetical protein
LIKLTLVFRLSAFTVGLDSHLQVSMSIATDRSYSLQGQPIHHAYCREPPVCHRISNCTLSLVPHVPLFAAPDPKLSAIQKLYALRAGLQDPLQLNLTQLVRRWYDVFFKLVHVLVSKQQLFAP